ncbi:MAG: hypothetical protein LBT26_01270 [Clostridiales Family XIII bacterium]|jgi:hypothetical protein|nr:hypothetical protein [Clostridiales Family XIII bacterium]
MNIDFFFAEIGVEEIVDALALPLTVLMLVLLILGLTLIFFDMGGRISLRQPVLVGIFIFLLPLLFSLSPMLPVWSMAFLSSGHVIQMIMIWIISCELALFWFYVFVKSNVSPGCPKKWSGAGEKTVAARRLVRHGILASVYYGLCFLFPFLIGLFRVYMKDGLSPGEAALRSAGNAGNLFENVAGFVLQFPLFALLPGADAYALSAGTLPGFGAVVLAALAGVVLIYSFNGAIRVFLCVKRSRRLMLPCLILLFLPIGNIISLLMLERLAGRALPRPAARGGNAGDGGN